MNIQCIKPSGILSQFINYYWVLESFWPEPEITERVIPNGTVELFFHFKNPLRVKRADGSEFQQPNSFLSGISSSYADVFSCGEIGLIAVMFYPHGTSHFFRFPLNELEGSPLNLSNLYYQEIRDIEEQLSEAASLQQRITVVEKFLLRKLNEINKNDSELVGSAIQYINLNKGRITSTELSKKLFVTPKTLERKFSTFVGKTPKQFIKIVRFQNAINSYSNYPKKSLTAIAYENGYFDQSHFINDFKMFSGYSPKEFFKIYPTHPDHFSS